MTTSDSLRVVLSGILRVLLHCLNCNQSEIVLQNMFATQRSIVYKVSNMFLSWEMVILLNRRFNVPFRSACVSRLVGISSGDLRRKDSSTLEEGINLLKRFMST